MNDTPTDIAGTARALAACGYCVLPLHAPLPGGGCTCLAGPNCTDAGKHPRIQGWATMPVPDERLVDRWLRAWPETNLGWRMGEGIVALDIDPDHGGQAWLDAHPACAPAETVRSLTGGGGEHRLYRVPPPLEGQLRNWVGEIAPGIDIRRSGGQIVIPPSRHKRGGLYQWAPGCSPFEREIAAAPPALLALLAQIVAAKAKPAGAPPPSQVRNPKSEVPPGLVRYALGGKTAGERNRSGHWLACRLVEEVAEESAGRAVLDLYGRRCNPALGSDEIEKIWRSAHQTTRYDPGKARPAPPAAAPGAAPLPPEAAPTQEPLPGEVGALVPPDAGGDAKPDLLDAGILWGALDGDTWAYDTTLGIWRQWAGTHWAAVPARAPALDAQAARILRLLGLPVSSPGRLDGCIRMAVPSCARPFPPRPGLIAFANGTLDVAAATLRPGHDPDEGLIHCLPYPYGSGGGHPRIDHFVGATIPDAGARQALLIHLGLALLGDTRLQNMVLLIGPRRSGKSTLLQLANALCGYDPFGSAGPELFDRASEGLRSRAAWNGRSLVTIEELPMEALRNEELVKIMSAHGGVSSRRLHQPEELKNQWTAKLLLATNDAPRYADHSGALTERLVPVRCPHSRAEAPETQDPFLLDALLPELPAWAVTCIAAGQAQLARRTTRYPLSPAMRADLSTIEQDGDALKSFVAEDAILDTAAWMANGHLYAAYQTYCTQNGNKPVSQKKLAGILVERYHCVPAQRRLDGKKQRGLDGIRLRTADDPDPDDGPPAESGTDGTDGTHFLISSFEDIRDSSSKEQIKQSVPSVPSVPSPRPAREAGKCATCGQERWYPDLVTGEGRCAVCQPLLPPGLGPPLDDDAPTYWQACRICGHCNPRHWPSGGWLCGCRFAPPISPPDPATLPEWARAAEEAPRC